MSKWFSINDKDNINETEMFVVDKIVYWEKKICIFVDFTKQF